MISDTKSTSQSLRRYVLKVQTTVALVVVISYTLVINFYFVHGLDEANFQDLHLEVNRFASAYNEGERLPLPDSIHFTGYLQWRDIPERVRTEFPSLKEASELHMQSVRVLGDSGSFPWPEQVMFMIAEPLNDGNTFYLTRVIDTESYDALSKRGIVRMFSLTWPLAIVFLIIMHFIVRIVLARVLHPFHQLSLWVDTVNLDNVDNSTPNFKFDELNKIAHQQQQALLRISEVLDKEQDFLRHASHELRTPIAVVKSNSELLTRVLTDEKASPALERIKRAAMNMQHMTETLLWLSRDEKGTITNNKVNVAEMVDTLLEDNQYLLQGKDIKISLTSEQYVLELAETPCRLVLNNLVRNAFQYTSQGTIEIECSYNKVTITNINKTDDVIDHTGADYGYGLGLRLVDKIVNKMGWQYTNKEIKGGRSVTVEFISGRVAKVG